MNILLVALVADMVIGIIGFAAVEYAKLCCAVVAAISVIALVVHFLT